MTTADVTTAAGMLPLFCPLSPSVHCLPQLCIYMNILTIHNLLRTSILRIAAMDGNILAHRLSVVAASRLPTLLYYLGTTSLLLSFYPLVIHPQISYLVNKL